MSSPSECAFITGGNGNLGRLVADKLLARGQAVVKFDLPGSGAGSGRSNETIVNGDVRDSALLKKTLDAHRPQSIYHLASLLSGSSETDLATAWEVNASASFELLRLAQEGGVEKFFFASSVATYGEVNTNPMPRDYPQWPQSMYGATKVAVERLGVYFRQSHGLDFRCLRFPLVVSPFAPAGAVSAFPSHAFKAARAGKPFSFPVAANTGVSTIFLEDVVDSIVDFTAAERPCLSQHVYNLHAYYLSAGMVAEAAARRFAGFDYRFEIIETVDNLISSWPDVVDDSAARQDWGWNPAYDFEASVERMCELLQS